jgi:hypothetical protein
MQNEEKKKRLKCKEDIIKLYLNAAASIKI